jgi:chromosome segregation ATPase
VNTAADDQYLLEK